MLFRRFYQTATVGYALLSNIYYNATTLKSKAFDAKKFNARIFTFPAKRIKGCPRPDYLRC